MLDMKEVRNWDEKLLNSKAEELRKNLFNLRMEKKTSGVEKSHRLRQTRREIAQVLTALSEKGRRK